MVSDAVTDAVTDDTKKFDASQSIGEAALERYSQSDDSLAELIRQHDIDIRDFMVLTFVCDQGRLGADQIAAMLGLSKETTGKYLNRLTEAGLVGFKNHDPAIAAQIYATDNGISVVKRVLNHEVD